MESNTVSQHILKYVEEMFIETEKENEEFKKIQLSKRLTEKFKENLAIAINEAYFGQVHEESPKNGVEPDKDQYELESAIQEIASRRKDAAKICKHTLEKTLYIEHKIAKAMQVDPSVGNVDLPPLEMVLNQDKLRFNAKKIAEYSKQNTKQVMKLNERAEEIITATSIFNSL